MDINDCRRHIDEINKEILKLLNNRAKYALKIGKLKQQGNLSVLNKLREENIFQEMQKRNKGPLNNSAIIHIFKVIMEECRNLQIENISNKED